ncbi:hypothetical protein [Frigoriglobus tundricola]|uniref:Uncharacterized protein n=1 Tax=Frigoriglobus tundricola TaxID=2774151 RepID=A0A6M5YW63_9BACT|nr:hypothetical protein [Frigoriglobus tundricola]QJW97551.1 hypothetical protein FTUN_5126 [Frigoriglobus tundricola]
MSSVRTAFLITRASLTTYDSRPPVVSEEVHYQPLEEGGEGPLCVPEVILRDREAANRERSRRERAVRELLNPFWFGWGTPDDLTSLSAEEFRTRVRGLALSPPPPEPDNDGDNANWTGWWDRESPHWTADQRAAVWDLLDKVRLYEVVEVELE